MNDTSFSPGIPRPSVVPIEHLEPDPENVRSKMTALDELADSLRAHGLIQPLVVRPFDGKRYRIIAGHRRYEAAKIAGFTQIPVTIRDEDSAADHEVQLVENIQRADVPALDVANRLKLMLAKHDNNVDEVAKRVSKHPTWVRRHLALLTLDKKMITAMRRQGLRFEQAVRASQVFKNDGLVAGLEAVDQLASGAMSTKQKPRERASSFSFRQRFAAPSDTFRAELIVETANELDEVKEAQIRSILSALERVLAPAA